MRWLAMSWWLVLLMMVNGVGGNQDQYWGVGVGAADAEVVEAAGVAQGEFAELVDGVVADAEVVDGG
jgi:hypothetical protein